MLCRVCKAAIPAPAYDAPAPALTSILTLLDAPTTIFLCKACGHAQSADIPDIQEFYDTGYRISLASDDHDQIFSVAPDGRPLFRTDHQAAIALRLLDLPTGATILDYGAAKADTLRKMHAARPDLRPHVFDVSSDYTAAWQGWVPREAQASYEVPSSWIGQLDAAMSHFVIEHVADPVGLLESISKLLRPGGLLLLSLPNVAANPGDIAVADHLNHFSEASLRHTLAAAGFSTKAIDHTSFPGAFFVVAMLSAGREHANQDRLVIDAAVDRAHDICAAWERSAAHLEEEAARFSGGRAVIYGAGFYGSWIYGRVQGRVELTAFLDRNPKLQDASHFGLPVLRPEAMPDDVDVLFIGLNPLKAREAIAAQPWLSRPGLQHVWL